MIKKELALYIANQLIKYPDISYGEYTIEEVAELILKILRKKLK